MASIIHRLRGFPVWFPRFFTGNYKPKLKPYRQFSVKAHPILLGNSLPREDLYTIIRGCNILSFPSQEEIPEEPFRNDLLSFIETTCNEIEGPHHCWLNYTERMWGSKQFHVLLTLPSMFADGYSDTANDIVAAIEKAKLLQQKYPTVFVFALCSGHPTSTANRTHLTKMIMEEYITFPILLSNTDSSEVVKTPCFVLFKDLKSCLRCFDIGVDGLILSKAIEESILEKQGKPVEVSIFKDYRCDQNEGVRDPSACSFMRNLLLHFPGCISADECENRLFLSDCNHHRILVFDGDGRILDCIGSSPGFEDGEFESAKMARPASSFYHREKNCLYFVDSENHGVRRADLGRRVVETLHPFADTDKAGKGLWGWMMAKLGLAGDDDDKAATRKPGSLLFPWHMMRSEDTDLFVINRRFNKLWVVDINSGEIKDFIQGFREIFEMCGEVITEKLSILQKIKNRAGDRSSSGLPADLTSPALVSAFTTFGDYVALCDTVGHRVFKICRKSGNCVDFRFSRLGMLGMPYWAVSPLENISSGSDENGGSIVHRYQFSNLFPGKVDLKVVIEIPGGTQLVEPVAECPVWTQTRGAAAEVSSNSVPHSDKVGVAQQWYDAMDNLTFSDPEPEGVAEEVSGSDDNPEHPLPAVDCSVHTSPGTSEVVVMVALYLERENGCGLKGRGREVFTLPVEVRVGLDCLYHKKSANLWDIMFSDSSLQVHVSFN